MAKNAAMKYKCADSTANSQVLLAPTQLPVESPNTDNDTILTPDTDEEEPEPSIAVRLDLAHRAWCQATSKQEKNIQQLSLKFGVNYSTLHRRINSAVSKAQASQAMQRLTVGKEEALRDQLELVDEWGWPLEIPRLQVWAVELLVAKGDTKELGLHWHNQYLSSATPFIAIRIERLVFS